jgi:hypothetical protein
MATELVRIPNVHAVSDGLALVVELPDKRRVGVPISYIDPSSQVKRPGDHGMLVVSKEMAENLGIAAYGF